MEVSQNLLGGGVLHGDILHLLVLVDGEVIDLAAIDRLAKLPSKETLVAKMLGSLNAPASGLVTVLNGSMRGLVVALKAIADKQGA